VKNKVKVSIITVCLNSENFIERTIKSVLNQNYDNLEYIIIDGKSTDKTIDIIKKYEIQFNGKMIWLSEKDEGIYDAMNKGIKLSSGDWLIFMNSGDYFSDDNVVAKIIKIYNKDKNSLNKTGLIYGNALVVNEEFGFKSEMDFEEGLKRTIEWYK